MILTILLAPDVVILVGDRDNDIVDTYTLFYNNSFCGIISHYFSKSRESKKNNFKMLIFWLLTNIFVISVGDRDNDIIVPLFIKKLFLRVISHYFMKSQDSKNRSNMFS